MTQYSPNWAQRAEIMHFEDGDPNENPWVAGKPTPENIQVEPSNPQWVETFAAKKAEIEQVLAQTALHIEHVGSTAVPDLAAKPVIDIDLIVADPEDEDSYVPALEALGYQLRIRERSWYQHRMLRHENPRVNLHVFGPSCPEHIRHILFRDWLRDHPADRQRYAEAKLLAKDGVTNATDYNARKQNVVRTIYQDIFRSRGWLTET